MDNLIAGGKAKPFILVMANSYGPGAPMGPPPAPPKSTAIAGQSDAPAPAGPDGPGLRRFNFRAFERVLIDDLIPFIDANFRTKPAQQHRAMAGLSLGGMRTRQIGLANLDKFSNIAIFSGGSIAPSELTDTDAFKNKVKMVFVSFGGTERGATTAKANVEALQKAGVKSVYYGPRKPRTSD